jgi:hypothetical protein
VAARAELERGEAARKSEARRDRIRAELDEIRSHDIRSAKGAE